MANRQYAYLIGKRIKPVQREISCVSVRNDQFAQTFLYRASNLRMPLKHADCIEDGSHGTFAHSRAGLRTNAFMQALQILIYARRIAYFRHGLSLGLGSFFPASLPCQ